jgi:TatD DNase family protein
MGERAERLAHRHARAALPPGRAAGRRGHPRRPARRGGRELSRRRSPERLEGIVDSHCHLQHAAFDADREAVIGRAREAGIARILVPGWDVASSEAALELAARHPDLLVAAVGVHPHHAAETDEEAWSRLESLVRDPGCVAVGEIGLDFYRNLSPPEAQRAAFARQLELAAEHGRPVLVHDRDAHREIRAALLDWRGFRDGAALRAPRGVLHAFSGDGPMALALTESGYLVSFALPVTFRSATGPRSAAALVAPETILLETDAPWLGPGAERRNEPTTVLRVAAEIGRLRGEEPEAIAERAGAAFERLVAQSGRAA